MRKRGAFALAIGSAALLAAGASSQLPPPGSPPRAAVPAPPPSATPDGAEPAACASRGLQMPSGELALLSCKQARQIVAHVRERLAAPAATPQRDPLVESIADWLDPHGLWSAAPDSPIRGALAQHAERLVREVEADPSSDLDCAASREVGQVARDWVREVRDELERARRSAPRVSAERALTLAAQSVFQDDPVTRPAKVFARDLGTRIGSFESQFGDARASAASAAERLAPEQSLDAWSHAVLAAVLRAYVPAVDPHGQWAPVDEEWSLYSADPAVDSEPRLWGRMVRTALGVRVTEDARPPLLEGDLVLTIGGIATAGLSVEQAEQLAHLESVGGETRRSVVVLRPGERRPQTLDVPLEQDDAAPGASGPATRRVPYGGGDVAVVTVPDVPDELGEDLERVIAELAEQTPPAMGLLLDLRGNGGGSLDGAARAIGVFLPGAPIFPLKRRDGVIELQHAPAPAEGHVWRGPVAALVDGYTASAAEMIAGALQAYRRGPVIGARTFGKGCVQEYFDDPSGAGVLRLTTMLFSLPDGAALQGVGLTPSLVLELPRARERERTIVGSIGPWQGPDVRAPQAMGGPTWPGHHGAVGGFDDAPLRAALGRLGAAPPRRSVATRALRGGRRPAAD